MNQLSFEQRAFRAALNETAAWAEFNIFILDATAAWEADRRRDSLENYIRKMDSDGRFRRFAERKGFDLKRVCRL